ncbi:MAG: HD domain-containing phosphohydrolase [Acidobacteriota bacterium]|nr:HD domain-containing phosphohydrolase [Acidobacteriota bacterium]
MWKLLGRLRKLRLRNLVLFFLLTYGTLPLLVAALASARENLKVVETQEQINLTHRVEALSGTLAIEIESARDGLQQMALTLASVPTPGVSRSVREQWVENQLRTFADANQELLYTRVLFIREEKEFSSGEFPAGVEGVMLESLRRVLRGADGDVHFVALDEGRQPAAVVSAIGHRRDRLDPAIAVTTLAPLTFHPEGQTTSFLMDSAGEILWTENPHGDAEKALKASGLASDLATHPTVFVSEYWLTTTDQPQRMIAQVSPIGNLGWGLVVQQPKAAAFGAARQVVNSTLVSALLLIVLALVFTVGASQPVSRPIQRLAETSVEIATGNFGGRLFDGGFGCEMVDLANNFNTMSRHVGESVDRLRRAAAENHELFLGSIRALLAVIEAKEPYTRGHSERVAAFSQSIARHLGCEAEFQEQIWAAGLLHDVGKLGIDDHILKKGNALTEAEFEEIKRHPIVGEEIMAPIEQLSYSLPAIRWHHEKWNGRGYPDGLRREAIPLMARIVSVADSFDAMTTQRVYQDAMSAQEAVGWIRTQNDVSFDAAVVEALLSTYQKEEVRAADPGGRTSI